MTLAFKRAFGRARAFSRRLLATTGAALCEIVLCLALCSLLAAFWRRQLYSRPPRLRKTNSNCLLWRSGAMFALPNVFHFFAHKLPRLSGRRFAFALVFARTFNCFFFWHNKVFTLLATRLDVNKKAAGVTSRRSLGSERRSLIVRPAGRRLVARHPAGRRPAFHAHGVRVPVFRGLGLVRLAVRGCLICPVRLDFVVGPCCLSLLLN